jgi:alcohol dehydrogenase
VVCGTLVAAATEVNIQVMLERDRGNPALAKYAEVGRLFTGDADSDAEKARTRLIERLQAWTETMRLPDLTTLGIRRQDFTRIVAHCRGSSMKTNPLALTDGEVERILELRLG